MGPCWRCGHDHSLALRVGRFASNLVGRSKQGTDVPRSPSVNGLFQIAHHKIGHQLLHMAALLGIDHAMAILGVDHQVELLASVL